MEQYVDRLYMEQYVDRLEEFIDDAGLDCGKIRLGFLRVAATPAHVRRPQAQVRLMSSLGFEPAAWHRQLAPARRRGCWTSSRVNRSPFAHAERPVRYPVKLESRQPPSRT
jgi:hypothetical protein